MKLSLIVLKTANPNDLATFYSKLGIEFEYHRHSTGPMHYAAQLGELVFEIYPLPKDKEKADDTSRLGFTVEDLKSKIENLRNLGTKIVKEPSMTEWGYMAIMEDPDGRKVEAIEKQLTHKKTD